MNIKKTLTNTSLIATLCTGLFIAPMTVQAEKHYGNDRGHSKSYSKSHSKQRNYGGHQKSFKNKRQHGGYNKPHRGSRHQPVRSHRGHGQRVVTFPLHPFWSYNINYQVDDYLSIGLRSDHFGFTFRH